MADLHSGHMHNRCLYCITTERCRCKYRFMRKGESGIEIQNTHVRTYAEMRKAVEEILGHYPDDQLCVFKFSVTRVEGKP